MSEKSSEKTASSGSHARALMRSARTAALSTLLSLDQSDMGGPYGSLVLCATAMDATPILLLSRLAVHTSNILHDSRACLLFDGTGSLEDPLTGSRLSVTGLLHPSPADAIAADRARFLSRYPSAASYADFSDFGFYRLTPGRAHLVAGFGKINWISAKDLLLNPEECTGLADSEEAIIAHMNKDHRDALGLYAQAGEGDGSWRLAGLDPEGCDLASGSTNLRLAFSTWVLTPEQARQEFIQLAHRARMGSLPGAGIRG